ncbi:MAG: hypothetical protein R3Y53_01860 [Bacillota bacterium]
MISQYVYDGPVMAFGKCINPRFVACTSANSEERARSNIKYQYKMTHKLAKSAKINLPGRINKA